jgi:GAF domain-containing protein
VIIDDVGTDQRWPQWSAAVASLPIRSVISTPLGTGKECLGALKVYAALPSAYTDTAARMLERFAAPAATLLSHIQTSELPHRISESLQASLHSRDLINQACGVLMERHNLGSEEALQALMRRAREAGTSLRRFSAALVAGTPAAGQ